jgi:hypothetical protein
VCSRRTLHACSNVLVPYNEEYIENILDDTIPCCCAQAGDSYGGGRGGGLVETYSLYSKM